MDDRKYTIEDVPGYMGEKVKSILADDSMSTEEKARAIHANREMMAALSTDGIPKPVMPLACIQHILEKLGY